jgi:hypothetical protein
VSDDGLRALASLTVLTSLDLGRCGQVSDDGLRALAGLIALLLLEAAPLGDFSAAAGVCDSASCPRRLPSYVGVDGASFIVCLVYCLSHLVCDVYLYCGIKIFNTTIKML